ncbi:cyclohexanecarboxylate-CoA ligase [Rhodoferax sp.]|uniref:cyclohexanecarboxylate-CoA ligase n=1 Tax=Rhodoferax sp. TaxID=50421 RepID=UPI0025E8949B|nr:cyclohexanecarboxylate-CoA ligase [Rhodoferax sp.]MCM2340902.1 cyclohexanecarboxylate-CoA ligase [Rhodoferax sp.]
MQFDPVLIHSRQSAMMAAGFWRHQTINLFMAQALQNCPDHPAVVAYRSDAAAPVRLSYKALDKQVDRIARGLQALGVGHSDVVSWQLPNWWEFIALALACARIGAVANPVMPIFRQRELKFMLDFGETKVFIVPKSYKGFDYEGMVNGMRNDLPFLQHLVVLGGDGANSFESLLLRDDTPALTGPGLEPDDVLLLMYTSGTTGEPKGVMHTSNTLFANLHGFIEAYGLTQKDVILGASPMAHLTGYGYLAMIPLILNATTVLQDIWEPKQALELVRDEGITFSMASSPFVADLCSAAEAGGPVSPRFANFCCAGAPIPPVLIERARRVLGLAVSSAWGMTECGAVTITEPARTNEKSGSTDGRAIPGIELKVVGPDGQALPTGQTGQLLVRGSSMFAGYLKRPQLNATDADGWFDTGDMAFLDADGYVRINGRSKDIIIRGGENIPVMEIENLLYKHPAVALVAIVGYPDARLGEKACAFVTVKPGHSFSLEEMSRYLSEHQVTRQYHPERLELMEDLPKTPSGKLQKFKLRESAKTFAA